ncbi:MAG TPA: acetylglutamate kinase [Sandaracinaceae bacterium LLY-WYZ-13_1]|nr:acetylglutamate kinase [Sandaracinaceae bacterium LLY-WYZ-13_1]
MSAAPHPAPLVAPRGVRALRGRVVVIKLGGAVVADDASLAAVAADAALLQRLGARPLVVHGAGPQIDAALAALGRRPRRVDGIRVTDEPTLEVVEMVLGGRVNQRVVAAIGACDTRAVGLTGRDAGWLRARRVRAAAGRPDPGLVGAPTRVRVDLPLRLLEDGFVPVVAPLAEDASGRPLNVNADAAAGAVAAALEAHALMLHTDAGGVRGARGEAMPTLSLGALDGLRAAGVIHGGMLPKLAAARRALEAGVRHAWVLPAGPRATTGTLLGRPDRGTRVVA